MFFFFKVDVKRGKNSLSTKDGSHSHGRWTPCSNFYGQTRATQESFPELQKPQQLPCRAPQRWRDAVPGASLHEEKLTHIPRKISVPVLLVFSFDSALFYIV